MNASSSAGRRVLLNRLYAEYAGDPAFAHMRAGVRGVVQGTGPVDPKLMFVGEAPGRNEDKQGRPFIGASGRFFNELLASVGLDRDLVWVTNAVKYRPVNEMGGNRPPTRKEELASVKYLNEEHRLLGRPPIVMLGKHSRWAVSQLDRRLLKMPSVDSMENGQWFWLGQCAVLPLYHPAYALYNTSNKPMLFDQFKAVLTPPEGPL